jgi:hypothetical protein
VKAPDSARAGLSLRSLLRQFVPLSLSDVVMALVDPLVITTLAHMPDARINIAAFGIAKAVAVCFESPIIMVLHASNTLAASRAARRAMARFTIVALAVLTMLVAVVTLPAVFTVVGGSIFSATDAIAERARLTLLLIALWPATIGWRRFFQGLLIHEGHSPVIARASVGRLLAVAAVLLAGFHARTPGWSLAGVALMTGLVVEGAWVTVAAWRSGALDSGSDQAMPGLPNDIRGVWTFYRPLATSMLVVWGGRALLLAVVARANDAAIAVPVWLGAWGFILVVANATRMVQQVIIRNKGCDERVLFRFALTVGIAASLVLVLIGATPLGAHAIAAYVGRDEALMAGIRPVIVLGCAIPVLVALQNALQGFLIREGKTQRVNRVTWLGTAVLLSSSALAVHVGLSGAMAAGTAMTSALFVETMALLVAKRMRSPVSITPAMTRAAP